MIINIPTPGLWICEAVDGAQPVAHRLKRLSAHAGHAGCSPAPPRKAPAHANQFDTGRTDGFPGSSPPKKTSGTSGSPGISPPIGSGLWLRPVSLFSTAIGVRGCWRWIRHGKFFVMRRTKSRFQYLEEARRLMDPDHAREYCFAVSKIIRRYIEERFHVHAPQLTTEEFLRDLAEVAGAAAGLPSRAAGRLPPALRPGQVRRLALLPARPGSDAPQRRGIRAADRR